MKYAAIGGADSVLGLRLSDASNISSPNGDGQGQAFRYGQILSSVSGTFVVRGPIFAKYAELKWVRGSLGWPTADQVCDDSSCSQEFQFGNISVTGITATATY